MFAADPFEGLLALPIYVILDPWLFALAVGSVVVVSLSLRPWIRSRRRSRGKTCDACGHILLDRQSRCPECGCPRTEPDRRRRVVAHIAIVGFAILPGLAMWTFGLWTRDVLDAIGGFAPRGALDVPARYPIVVLHPASVLLLGAASRRKAPASRARSGGVGFTFLIVMAILAAAVDTAAMNLQLVLYGMSLT